MRSGDLRYKSAVISELDVPTFCDSNGDGWGDFQGLSRHLDHELASSYHSPSDGPQHARYPEDDDLAYLYGVFTVSEYDQPDLAQPDLTLYPLRFRSLQGGIGET